jgi:hypothetical protein
MEEPPSLAQSTPAFGLRRSPRIIVGQGQLCRIPYRLPTAAKMFPLVTLKPVTLELMGPYAWYNVQLAKSIGEFPGSVKWPYCGAKPLGHGLGIEMSSQGIP